MKITPELLKTLRVEINAALTEVAKKHGISLAVGNSVYDPQGLTATMKLEVGVIDEGGLVVTKEVANLRNMYRQLGLKEEHLSQVFKVGTRNYSLHGYKNTGKGIRRGCGSKPYLVTCLDDNKIYVMTGAVVKRALGIVDWETKTGGADSLRG